MTNRFEELEEQLKQLETIPLVSTSARVHAPEDGAVHAVGAQQRISPNTRKPSGATGQDPGLRGGSDQLKAESEREPLTPGALGRVSSAVSSIRGRRWRTRLLELEEQAVSECQERMREVVGGVIEEAQRQLEDLTNELVPRFQLRLERSIEDSVGTLTNQAAQQLKEQTQARRRREAAVVSTSEREDVSQARREWREGAQCPEVTEALAGGSMGKELAQAFRPVVEEIQLKSAAFLDRLNLQLHSTLKAFGEKATRHAAEEFARIAVEALQGQPRRLNSRKPEMGKSNGAAGLTPESSRTDVRKLSPKREAISLDQSARRERQRGGAKACGAHKLPNSMANWRILGLG
ncbi:MAG TPA: hypothetical protein VMI06_12400 [Terriglobia bacterium]|nr:hypothetical protein [Terriglobia bacterium]